MQQDEKRTAPDALLRAISAALPWIIAGILNAVCVSILVPWPVNGWTIRIQRHLTDIGHHVFLAMITGTAVWTWSRFAFLKVRMELPVLAIVSAVIGFFTMGNDFPGIIRYLGNSLGLPLVIVRTVLVIVLAQSVPAMLLLGRLLDRNWIRALTSVLAVFLFILNNTVSLFTNPGAHLFASWGMAALMAPSIGSWLDRLVSQELMRQAFRRRTAALSIFFLALMGLLTVVLPVPNDVRLDLRRWQGTVLFPFVSRGLDDGPVPESIVKNAGPYFRPRQNHPAVPASEPDLLPDNPVVILLTVDALRADILMNPEYHRFIPNLVRMAKRSTFFTRARSPGSATCHVLPAMFTGKYSSQLYWSDYHGGLWLAEDRSVHFAELLRDAGVRTVLSPAARWLEPDFGILRGFSFGQYRKGREKWIKAGDVNAELLRHLDTGPGTGQFLYAHYLDTHAPDFVGGTAEEFFQLYLMEMAKVDSHIGQMIEELKKRNLMDRTWIIVGSDHGEAFGEHQRLFHATSLYEELLRIPLFIHAPSIPVQAIDTPVSLVDVGPTILDLFGLETPGVMMGQSLVPFLRGERPVMDRPVVAETGMMQAMIFPDGIKVIRDMYNNTLEVYDLKKDPGELRNLSDQLDDELSEHVDLLRYFFRVHSLRRVGYLVNRR